MRAKDKPQLPGDFNTDLDINIKDTLPTTPPVKRWNNYFCKLKIYSVVSILKTQTIVPQ